MEYRPARGRSLAGRDVAPARVRKGTPVRVLCGLNSRSNDQRRRVQALIDPERREKFVVAVAQIRGRSGAALRIALVRIATTGEGQQTVGRLLERRLTVEPPRSIRVLALTQPVARPSRQ